MKGACLHTNQSSALQADKTLTAILQRVLSASVTVDQEVVSKIGKGILVFAAVAPGDTEKEADSLAAKVLKLKLWDDEAGGRVRSPSDIVASCRTCTWL
jgi:D-Tyr-tRNAtyr deacylase